MICKEVDYAAAIGRWQKLIDGGRLSPRQKQSAISQLAGLQAEKDMAYHLKVFFADRDAFAVFNNLKIEHNGLTAQIDHLVLTRWTAYFIESKSVSQVITVNEHGEWGRLYNRRFSPIESPIEQSRRHKETLFSFMQEHRQQFMGKLLGMQKNFAHFLTPKPYVAISTRGQIQGRGRSQFKEVMKADQIANDILAHHKALDISVLGILSPTATDAQTAAFNKKEFAAALQFLLASDKSISPEDQVDSFAAQAPSRAEDSEAKEREASAEELGEDTAAAEVSASPAARQFKCRKCQSEALCVAHGPYGYYLKCRDCGGNTPIAESCAKCQEKLW